MLFISLPSLPSHGVINSFLVRLSFAPCSCLHRTLFVGPVSKVGNGEMSLIPEVVLALAVSFPLLRPPTAADVSSVGVIMV